MTWITTSGGLTEESRAAVPLAPAGAGEAPYSEQGSSQPRMDANRQAPSGSSAPCGKAASLRRTPGSLPEAAWTEELGWSDQRVLVVDANSMRALGTAAAMEGYLWIALEPPRPAHRGKLALYIEEAIETALQARGAPFPGIGASSDLDASLSDQLYRARLVELRGIALGVTNLGGIANLGGVLDAEDSAALRWWIAASMDRPVRLVLSAENRLYRVYPSPVAVSALLEGLRATFSDAPSPRAPSTETAQSVAAMELSDLPPDVEPRVELPELDRALGLVPEEYAAENVEPAELPKATTEGGQAEKGSAADEPKAIVSAEESGSAAALAPVDPAPCAAPSVEGELSGEAEESAGAVESAGATPSVEGELSGEAEESAGAVEEDDLGGDDEQQTEASVSEGVEAVLTASNSPLPAEATDVEARPARDPMPSVQVPRPVVKSTISMEAARRAATERRRPFLVAADDEDSVSEGSPSGAELAQATEEVSTELAEAPRAVEAPSSVESSHGVSEAAATPASREASPESTQQAPAEPPEDPFEAYARDNYRTWVRELEAARGPKPLAHIERQFVTAYTRLQAAIERGIGGESARGAVEQWSRSFSKSYQDAFDALRLRGKRPTMVLDVPELAQRVGRLHGARRVQLLMVDGMRFDLGMMIQDRLKQRAEASLTERMLLWSALPTTTTHQLELIGKGPDGLKEPFVARSEEEPEAVVARGAGAHTLRRIRAGRRELFKLDLIEAALREAKGDGAGLRERLTGIADDAATVIEQHFSKQASRTLVVVFGDHGFRLDSVTGEAAQGGTSPEEVLVPAFAWLTGAVH